jgi:hypothetical protein
MKNTTHHLRHECDCGREIEVKITLSDAGFESSTEGPGETTWEHSFGYLKIEMETTETALALAESRRK